MGKVRNDEMLHWLGWFYNRPRKQWKFYTTNKPVRTITGYFTSGHVMRRWNGTIYEYRATTEDDIDTQINLGAW